MYKIIRRTCWLPITMIATVFTFPIIVIVVLTHNDNWTDFWGDITEFYGDMWEVV